MKRAVIYARFSCSKQREASIDDQLRVCREWCDREGFEVVREYCDYAVSGRTDDRPEFQRMVDNAGESDAVVVYMMDRFSRDPYDAPVYKRHFRERGVRIISAMENVPDTPEGMLLDKLLEGMAAMESMKNSVRTRRGMEGNALKCLYNGDRVYGYSVDESRRYVVDAAQAAVVREVFDRRISGEPCNAIARDLASRGVRTYRGLPCSPTMVANIVRNERYKGVYVWGDVRVDGGMPQIVDAATWDAAQTAPRRKQRKNEEWREYALSGRSKCMCGASMIGVSGHGRSGKRYDYYQCGRKCGQSRNVRADMVEAAIVDAVRGILSDRSEAIRIASKVAEYVNGTEGEAKRKAALEAKRAASDELRNLMDMMKRGISHPDMQREIDAAVERRERAERELLLMDAEERFDAEDFADFLQFGATLDDAAILGAFVGEVVFMDGVVAVTFNYKDEKNDPAYCEVEVFEQMKNGSPCVHVLEHLAVLVIPLRAA